MGALASLRDGKEQISICQNAAATRKGNLSHDKEAGANAPKTEVTGRYAAPSLQGEKQ
jgi:hypothetical protein